MISAGAVEYRFAGCAQPATFRASVPAAWRQRPRLAAILSVLSPVVIKANERLQRAWTVRTGSDGCPVSHAMSAKTEGGSICIDRCRNGRHIKP